MCRTLMAVQNFRATGKSSEFYTYPPPPQRAGIFRGQGIGLLGFPSQPLLWFTIFVPIHCPDHGPFSPSVSAAKHACREPASHRNLTSRQPAIRGSLVCLPQTPGIVHPLEYRTNSPSRPALPSNTPIPVRHHALPADTRDALLARELNPPVSGSCPQG